MAVPAYPRYYRNPVPTLSVPLATYIVVSLYLNYRKLPQFKGPFLASISGLWLFRETLAGRMYVTCAEALETYGMGSSNSLQFRGLFLLSKSCMTRLACPDHARHDRHPRPSHSRTHERTAIEIHARNMVRAHVALPGPQEFPRRERRKGP